MSLDRFIEEDSTEQVAPALEDSQPTREFRALRPPPRRARPDRLIQVEGPGATREISLAALPKSIGRDPTIDICVPSAHVSRHHLQIRRDGDDIVCVDLDSRNGAWLNTIRIHAASLREGDTLQVGDAVFVFYRGS